MDLTEDEIQAKLNLWFQTLHRLAQIQADDVMKPAFAPSPLREDIAECVEMGWVMALTHEADELLKVSSKDEDEGGQMRLLLRPEGWKMYDAMCQDLADQGRPILGWMPNRHQIY